MRFWMVLPLAAIAAAQQWSSLTPAKEVGEHWLVEAAPASIWSLKDGVISCLGKPNGFLRSRKSYRNYVFRAEWRFEPRGWEGAPEKWPNAGFFIHAQESHDPWPRSLEVQGHYGEAGSVFGVRGGEVRGARRGPIVSKRVPFGEWDRYEIIARNGWVRVILNGEIVNEGFDASPAEGNICLQSEGWPVQYRKMEILELPAGGFPDVVRIEQDLLDVARVAIQVVDGSRIDEGLLQRLTRLTGYAYDINLWKPVAGQAKRIAMAAPGAQRISQFWQPGGGDIEQSFAIRKVFDPGQRMTVKDKPGWISVLAPVLDSSKKVVAMLEFVCRFGG